MLASNRKKPFKIAIVAGEVSGDLLGSKLMESIRSLDSSIEFIGVGGSKMTLQGLDSFFVMDEISVMGIIEPLLKLRKLLRLRKELKNFLADESPDLFIGIDSPDFNIPVARFLKKRNIRTIQYVSPSVWAWREGRIKSMEKAIDAVFTLFPFEKNAYSKSAIDAFYIGHPLSYDISLTREEIHSKEVNSVALLPGSRRSEIISLGDQMISVAKALTKINSRYKFYLPLSDRSHLELFNEDFGDNIHVSFGDSQKVLKRTSIALITSGTATLESVLSYTPCVTLYKTNWLSYLLIKPLLKIESFALPNLIIGEKIMPELLQGEVSLENIISAMQFIEEKGLKFYEEKFNSISNHLRAGGPEKAAKEILALLN